MTNALKSKIAKAGLGLVAAASMLLGAAQVSAYTFTAPNLKFGMKSDAVVELQKALGVSPTSRNFGPKTLAAVKAYQAAHGIAQTGQVGPLTRASLNAGGGSSSFAPAGCTSASGFSPVTGGACYAVGGTPSTGLPAGCSSTAGYSMTTGVKCDSTGTTPVTGAMTVSLASDTPGSTTIPDAANANFTKFNISAGPSTVSITSLYVTRSGLSINSDIENIKILDENMVQVGSVGSLNSNNKAQITFSPALTVSAGTTKAFYIRAGIVNATTGGKTVAMSIASASDVVANTTVGGSFPVVGNVMNTVSLDIGTVTIDEDGTVTDSQPNGGDTNIVLNKFKLTAGSTEGVTVRQIAFERQGTASATDVANIELYDVTKSVTLGTAATWDANGMATFNNLNISLDKGESRRFEIRVDIIGGASLTVNADLTDGSDVYVQATGNTYGFYITPTNAMTDNSGKGLSDQTIQSGSLTVTKSASTPATGNISAGSDVTLAIFDFLSQGEAMKITSINLDMDLTTMTYDEVTNVKLVDASTGTLLAGPKDLTSGSEATFTDTLILPVGLTKVKVTANIATSVSAGDSLNVDLDNPATGITVRGMSSNDTVTPTPASAVSSNELTVQAATLTAVTNTTPAARSIVKGQQDFVFATASLSAANSGDDVNVSALVIESTANVAADDTASGSEDIDNVEIWADLTSGSSARGDVFETKISETKQFAGTNDGDAVLSFNLNPILTVVKNTTVSIAVVADLSSSAVTSDTFAVSLDTDSGDVTANGKDTGSSVTVTPTGAGQAMTVAATGTLTTTVDSSSPTAALLLDTTAEQTVAVFRLAANNTENLDVDSIKITDEGTNGDDVVAMYKFYSGATLIGSQTPDGSGNAEVFLTDGALVIPANDYKLVTVKVVLNDIDGTGFVNGDTIAATINAAGDIDTTGLASGSAVDSTGTNYDAATHTAYETYPTVAFNNTGISTVLGASSNYLAGKIVITNTGNKDITFDSDDQIKINFEISGTLTSATDAVTLKKSDGTALDTVNMGATTGSTSGTIVFADNTLTVPAGLSETVSIFVNTGGLTADGNTLQPWLSDDAAGNLEFSINAGTADYTEADYVFKGDIFGLSHVNPS
ncbi:MAG: peptidoglycan-binding protein [Candidatus Pacebacteria bacterium]|nr:peptidoglycan-binding protein [Candidatus Paceibacterota bacterium]